MFERIMAWIRNFLAEEQFSTMDDSVEGLATNAFFLGRKTRLLASFVVGTVDQLLLAALNQKHMMLLHLGLAGKVVIVDEIHAYDAYMTCYMRCMLSWVAAYRTPVILLSATLPGVRRGELVAAYLRDERFAGREALENERVYPLLTRTDRRRTRSRSLWKSRREKFAFCVTGTKAWFRFCSGVCSRAAALR